MFRRRDFDDDPVPLLLGLEPEPELRDERDPDPLVEAATERLRQQLSVLDAIDNWGREVPWRQVARIALGALAADPREPDEAEVPEQRESAEQVADDVQWRSFFRAVDEADRFLGAGAS